MQSDEKCPIFVWEDIFTDKDFWDKDTFADKDFL